MLLAAVRPTAPASREAAVSIGATLAAARRRAGLSVVEVGQRARVPGDVVQGIEHDAYPDGGHARDQIRAIAGAVGADPGPLIEEFDETWGSAPEVTAAEALPPEIEMPPRTRERRRVRWAAAPRVRGRGGRACVGGGLPRPPPPRPARGPRPAPLSGPPQPVPGRRRPGRVG